MPFRMTGSGRSGMSGFLFSNANRSGTFPTVVLVYAFFAGSADPSVSSRATKRPIPQPKSAPEAIRRGSCQIAAESPTPGACPIASRRHCQSAAHPPAGIGTVDAAELKDQAAVRNDLLVRRALTARARGLHQLQSQKIRLIPDSLPERDVIVTASDTDLCDAIVSAARAVVWIGKPELRANRGLAAFTSALGQACAK